MYKSLLIISALLLLSACAGTTKDDDLSVIAAEKYKDASAMVDKAKSYSLDIGEAESQLSQAADQIEEEKYDESIISSESAYTLASDAISVYEQAQAKSQQDLEAYKRAKEEQSRIAAEAKRLSEATSKYVVQAGDSLWKIAARQEKLNHDALSWPIIYKENQSSIKNPDLIRPNMTLHITAATEEQIAKARRHAQTRGVGNISVRKNSDQIYLQQ